MAGIAMREHGLSGRQRLTAERAGVTGDELGVETFVPEVALQLRNHADGVDRRHRPEGERYLLGLGAELPGAESMRRPMRSPRSAPGAW